MKDTDTLTLKAFLAALSQQTAPLPPQLQQQLKQLSHNLEPQLATLHQLAKNTPSLTPHYQTARRWYLSTAAERSKSARLQPADAFNPHNTEIDNALRDTRQIRDIQTVLADLDRHDPTDLATTTQKILQAPDPVQAFNEFYPVLL